MTYHWYTSYGSRMQLQSALSEGAYDTLKDMILGGTLPLHEALSERQLATRLKVSRMPVREALRQLENDGLIEIVPFRGAFIRQLSLTEVRDIYEARQAIEGMAAFLAAKRGMTEKLRQFGDRLRTALNQGTKVDLEGVQRDGAAFHIAVVEASRNAELLSLVRSLCNQVSLTLKMALRHDPQRIRTTVAEHLQILKAIESGDGQRSRARMVAHLAAGLESRVRILRSLG